MKWYQWCSNICIDIFNLFCHSRHYLKREQAKILNPQIQNNLRSLIFCIVEWFLLFAIFHFGRRKFNHNPVVFLPLKSISERSNMFTRFDFIQIRLNMKWLRKLYFLLGLLPGKYDSMNMKYLHRWQHLSH